MLPSRAIAKRSRACLRSEFVVGVPGSNPTISFSESEKIRFSGVGCRIEVEVILST